MEEKDFERLLAEFRNARHAYNVGPYCNSKNLRLQRASYELATFVDSLASVADTPRDA
jgi:hypothetical protein